jgi:ubiquinone/menaquinone biosynthesis C-methylase UbiE
MAKKAVKKVEKPKEEYGEEYFEGGVSNYTNYKDEPMFMQRALWLLEKLQPIKGQISILEVGCAKGFMVQALRELGANAYGLDVSEYAVNASPVKQFLTVGSITNMPFEDNQFDCIVSFDILEHLKESEVDKAVSELYRVSSKQIHSITTPEYVHGDDPTHYCMKPIEWWKDKFKGKGAFTFIKHAGEH